MPDIGKVGFADVKAILDKLVQGREDQLAFVHGNNFGWSTKEQLQHAVAVPFGTGPGYRLIEPGTAGAKTNLVKALREGVGGYPQMPLDGPYATDEEIQMIIAWIDAQMPD